MKSLFEFDALYRLAERIATGRAKKVELTITGRA
jgi:hypothetical protein